MPIVPLSSGLQQPSSGGGIVPIQTPEQPNAPGIQPVDINPQASDTLWGALGYNLTNGLTDTVRGGAQILGIKEDEMREQQAKLDANLEQYGAPAYAAWIGGMIFDPVAWALPLSRIKHLGLLRHAGKIKKLGMAGKILQAGGAAAAGGAIAGGLGYVDEKQDSLIGDGKMTRGEQALLGAVGGGVIGGAGTLGAAKLASSGVGEKAWKVLQNPEVGLATVGAGLGGFAGYHSGINETTEPLLGDLFSKEFVEDGSYAKWRNALIGASVGAVAGNRLGRHKSHWFVPDDGLVDAQVHARSRVVPRAQSLYEESIAPTAKKVDKLIRSVPAEQQPAIKRFMHQIVTEGPKTAKKMMTGQAASMTGQSRILGAVDSDDLVKTILKDNPDLMRSMREVRVDVRKSSNGLAKELVDEGLLDERLCIKNKNQYMRRLYEDPEKVKRAMSQGGYELIGDLTDPRGLVKTVDEAQWAKMQQDPKETSLGWEKWDAKPSLEKEGKFEIRRDWTREEREQMGESMDLLDAFQTTGKMISAEISKAKYLDELSKLPSVSSDDMFTGVVKPTRMGPPIPDELRVRDTRASRSMNPPEMEDLTVKHDWKVPDEKKYGQMRGRHVSEETYADLVAMTGDEKAVKLLNSDMMKKYRKLNSYWKATKTVLNPAVHFNNFMSNIIMFDLGVDGMGLRKWKVLGESIKDLTGKSGKMSEAAREAQARGVFSVNLTEELKDGDWGKLGKSMMSQLSDGGKPQKMAMGAMDHTNRTLKFAKKWTYDKMAKAYELEDNVFRLALFKAETEKLMKQGMVKSMAMDRAASKGREFFVDYSRSTPALDVLKALPLPFLSYTYGIVPRLAETAVKHPLKIAKWASIGYLLNEAGAYGSEQSLARTKEEERLMGETNDMYSAIGLRNKIRLPDFLNPFDNDSAYLDITRAIPGGAPFAATAGDLGQIKQLPQQLQLGGGALGAIGYPMMGIDQFRGREIPEGQKLESIIRNFIPNVPGVPGSFAQNKIDLAEGGARPRYKDEHTEGTAWAAAFGAKITPNDNNKNRQRIKFTYDAKIGKVDKQISALKGKKRNKMITDNVYKEKMKELQNKKQRIKRNRNKALNG